MNTVKSFWLGWGSLVVGGGVAYYFAKKEINAHRLETHMKLAEQQRRNAEIELQYQYQASSTNHDTAGLPSEEASGDPAPTRHEPENDDQRAREKSKYEASAVYKARKGDRFS